ncbi:MAG: oligopeptide/dipeptide ABC transporter ATP-binding protein, partial [Promethearchaeota archaeon]
QTIRNELWIQIFVVIAVFAIGILLLKIYNKHILKLETTRNEISLTSRKKSPFKGIIIINLIWFLFNLLGSFISFALPNYNIIACNTACYSLFDIIEIPVFIVNIIIGAFLLIKLYNIGLKNALITITIIQAILLGIGIFFNLFIKLLQLYIYILPSIHPEEEIMILLTIYLISLLILCGIAAFLAKYGSKIQLVYETTNFIALIAFTPGLITISIFFLVSDINFIFFNTIQINAIAIVISVTITLTLKRLSYRTISLEDLDEMEALEKGEALLEIKDLKVHYPLLKGVLRKQIGAVKAVDGVSFEIKAGETLGLVGESGCGKSTVAMAILGLVEKKSGTIILKNEPLPKEYTQYIRKRIQMVFQDPDASLNPQLKVVDIIAEPLKNILGISNKIKIRKRVLKLLEEVSLKKEHIDRYPHEFSGGQKQRIIIARALACNPELIILDEPTSALDVSVQAQILNLLRDLQKTYNYGFLFITHDLSVVNHIADRVAVMYLGKIVEIGSKQSIFSNPTHPYSKALLASRSEVTADEQKIRFVLKGEVPSPINPPSGCSFHPRCYTESYDDSCKIEEPHKIEVEEGHYIWCVNERVLRDTHEFVF